MRTANAVAGGDGVDSGLPVWFRFSPFFFWFSWSVGAAIAEATLRGKVLRPCLPLLWPVLFVLSCFVKPLSNFSFLLAALTTANLIIFLLARPNLFAWLPRPIFTHLKLIGVVSYSVYLFHQPLLLKVPHNLNKIFPGPHHELSLYLACLLSWAVIATLSWLHYRYVELPSIGFGKRWARVLKAPEAQPSERPPTSPAG